MKILPIFAKKLYAICSDNDEEIDVYTELREKWTDVFYVREFVKKHKKDIGSKSISKIVRQIIKDAESIDDTLYELAHSDTNKIDELFVPLNNFEYQEIDLLPTKKTKFTDENYYRSNSHIRIYGIKIETNCFIITGGAIKFTFSMGERKHTAEELKTINQVRDYLIDEGVIDKDSFNELLNDQV